MEKNKAGKEDREYQRRGTTNLEQGQSAPVKPSEAFTEEMTFKQRHKENKRISPVSIWGRTRRQTLQ